MKGIVLTRFGDPAQVVELKTIPDSQPPGPGEVVVRVTKRQLHPGNLAMIRGRFNIPLPADGFLVPGSDGVGVVEAVGEGMDFEQGVKPGARVTFNPSPGAWAERLKARAELVTPIPNDLPDAIAARRRGLKVVSAVRSTKGAKFLSARFPELTVVSTADGDRVDQVRRAAGGRPLQVIMDPVGGAMVGDLVGLVGDDGALLFYGGLAPEPITFPSIGLAHHEIMFKGVSSSRWLQNTSAEQRREDVAEAIEIGRATPEQFDVEADYELAGFADAIKHIEPGRNGAVLISSDS